jgi:acetyl-CoA carboxylase biotin carboxyl carrier protein
MLAERGGTVTAIKVTAGDVVQDGDVLVVLD